MANYHRNNTITSAYHTFILLISHRLLDDLLLSSLSLRRSLPSLSRCFDDLSLSRLDRESSTRSGDFIASGDIRARRFSLDDVEDDLDLSRLLNCRVEYNMVYVRFCGNMSWDSDGGFIP